MRLSRRVEAIVSESSRRASARGRLPGTAGQALVELALIIPVVLVLLAAGADLARMFNAQVVIESAARAGALEAATSPSSWIAGQPCDPLLNRVMCAVKNEASGSSPREATS